MKLPSVALTARWWAPAWLAIAWLQSLAFDASQAHWLTLWGYAFGYVAIPFWLGWWAPSALATPRPWMRAAAAAVACALWQLI